MPGQGLFVKGKGETVRQKMTVVLLTVGLLVAAALLQSCSFNILDVGSGSASSATAPNPLVSPSPGGACELGNIGPGTEGDARTIKRGSTLRIGVSLFGPQGLPLVESCLSQYTPVWRKESGPCEWTGSHDGVASAPASAAIDSVCVGGVDVGGKHARLELVVVGP